MAAVAGHLSFTVVARGVRTSLAVPGCYDLTTDRIRPMALVPSPIDASDTVLRDDSMHEKRALLSYYTQALRPPTFLVSSAL
jgi:hypothetical protein